LLPPELQEAFRQALLQPHPRDGVWTIRNAAEWLSERLGRPVDPRRAWNWMKRLSFAPSAPVPGTGIEILRRGRPSKKLLFTVLLLKYLFPWLLLEVWAFDERRLGLKPVYRRVWAPPGEDAPGLGAAAVPVAVRVRLRAPEYGGERVLAAAHGERRGLLGGSAAL
jgi:hypothetical protein